jgi:ATP-dependent Clp protease ATP-binding subunit ClpC
VKRRFHLYVREHHSGWFTASVLTIPTFAAYGPYASALRTEIADVLEEELTSERLVIRSDTFFDPLEQRSLNVELKAVQHDRLVTVPMRFTVLVHRPDPKAQAFEVRIPRIAASFRIEGEENIMPWAEETVRGRFHLQSLSTLLEHQYERSERIEEIEVSDPGPSGRKKTRIDPIDGHANAPSEPLHPLSGMGIELVREAREGRSPRAEFRDEVVAEMFGILSSRRSSSVLLVGASGVGKTAIVNEAAHRIAEKRATPDRLEGSKIWFISGSRIIAGTRFLGEWQARCQKIIELIQAERDILYIGNILEILVTDTTRTGLDLAQFLLASIQSGELTVIGEATPDALSVAEAINLPFVRAFQRLPVPMLKIEEANTVLHHAAKHLEKTHQVKLATETVASVLDVVARFGDQDSLPGSGLHLLEEMVRLSPEASSGERVRSIAPKGAVRAFSRTSGFPEALLDPDRLLDVGEVRRFFSDRVIGQPRAMELLTNVIMLLKSGLNDPTKPLGSFLFMGPTGVGKTESALVLAEYLFSDRKRLVRFDMSEYGYPGSAIRLVDGPDGQGELTKRVREQPFSVLLFDEIEKADLGVFDVFLQILGEGRLTDGTGRTVRFVHTIVIMTSNLGAKRREPIGIDDGKPIAPTLDRHYVEAAEKFFRPELINRIDHLVPFADLDRPTLTAIAERLLDSALVREGLVRRGIDVRFDREVIDFVSRAGFDPKYGARPMKRAVEAEIMTPLARTLLALPDGAKGTIRLAIDGGALRIAFD